MFVPAKDLAVIVLWNRSIDDGTLADDIGRRIMQRLLGRPATTVEPK